MIRSVALTCALTAFNGVNEVLLSERVDAEEKLSAQKAIGSEGSAGERSDGDALL